MQGAKAVTSLKSIPALRAKCCPLLATRARLARNTWSVPMRLVGRGSGAWRRITWWSLHACGELHRRFGARGGAGRCGGIQHCAMLFDQGRDGRLPPVSAAATLRLDAGDLRLAITESVGQWA